MDLDLIVLLWVDQEGKSNTPMMNIPSVVKSIWGGMVKAPLGDSHGVYLVEGGRCIAVYISRSTVTARKRGRDREIERSDVEARVCGCAVLYCGCRLCGGARCTVATAALSSYGFTTSRPVAPAKALSSSSFSPPFPRGCLHIARRLCSLQKDTPPNPRLTKSVSTGWRKRCSYYLAGTATFSYPPPAGHSSHTVIRSTAHLTDPTV